MFASVNEHMPLPCGHGSRSRGSPARESPFWPAVNEAVTRGNVIGWLPGRRATDGDDCCLVALKQQRRRARTRPLQSFRSDSLRRPESLVSGLRFRRQQKCFPVRAGRLVLVRSKRVSAADLVESGFRSPLDLARRPRLMLRLRIRARRHNRRRRRRASSAPGVISDPIDMVALTANAIVPLGRGRPLAGPTMRAGS